jgi:hypothetical protein
MKKLNSCFLVILVLSISFNLSAQNLSNKDLIIPEGLNFEYGIGGYAVTDEYISKEKYSGASTFYSLEWINHHSDYIYHLKLSFHNAAGIKNNNVAADIIQFSLNQGFSYSLPEFKLFGKDTYLLIGPSAELFAYYNDQKIAVDGFDYSQSLAVLLSGNFTSRVIYKMSSNFDLEGSLDFSLLSLGIRIIDPEEEDISPAKLLTLFTGTNLNVKFGPRYYLMDNLSLRLSYLLNITRISSWTPLLSASDNLIFSFTYGF